MEFLFGGLGMLVHIIFIFKREWLFERKSFAFILLASIGLFLLSYVLRLNDVGDPNLVRIMTIPLLAAIIFYVIKYVFFKLYNRNPEDTFWSMDIRQMKDGIFNFIFWVLGILLPVVITYEVLP